MLITVEINITIYFKNNNRGGIIGADFIAMPGRLF